MKNILLAASALVAVSAPSFAADLPARVATPAPYYAAPVFTWTGVYVGLNAGTFNSRIDNAVDFNGGTFGVRAGYDAQFDSIVAGVMLDAAYSNAKFDVGVASLESKFIGGANVRLGFLAMPATLLYVTGGYTYVSISSTIDLAGVDYAHGWNIGGGIEHRFTANWSALAEYRYHKLETNKFKVDVDAHTVKLGVNYRF